MKKIIIPILLITLFGCRRSVEYDEFQMIVTNDLIKQSLVVADKDDITLTFLNNANGAIIETEKGSEPNVLIIVKKGKSLLSDERYNKKKRRFHLEVYLEEGKLTSLS